MLNLTTIYVHNNNQSQTVACSDGTQGVMRVKDNGVVSHYSFKFYSHAHLGFWLDKTQFRDGKSLIVKGILENEKFKIRFIN